MADVNTGKNIITDPICNRTVTEVGRGRKIGVLEKLTGRSLGKRVINV